MDNNLLLQTLVTQHWLEAEDDKEMFDSWVRLAAAVLVIGSNEDHAWAVENRRQRRQYLRRAVLLPDPRINTPWTRLYLSHDDPAFITTMGINFPTFQAILAAGFGHLWYTRSITHPDTDTKGKPRAGGRSLNAEGGLGLVLHWLSSTMRQVSLQQIFALVPSTVSRYLRFALPILLEVLKNMPSATIAWPHGHESLKLSGYVSIRHPLLDGVFSSMDGLNLPCQVSSDIEMENATYNGWLHSHFVSSVIVFSSKGQHPIGNVCWVNTYSSHIGEIIACHINCPGSWHNSRVAQGIYEKLDKETPDGFCLVADSAFPRGHDQVAGKILIPLKAGQTLPLDSREQEHTIQLSQSILSYHQTAEWGMRELQGSFGRLWIPLEAENLDQWADLIETCFRLHNLRTRLVDINHIKNVYVPIWRSGSGERVWEGFEHILFSDQRKHDRVSRFHVKEEWY